MIYVAELEPGISDDAVLDIANRESAVLVTADKDFGEIVFRQGRSSGGVVLIRLEGLSPEGKARTVSAAINTHLEEIPGNFSVLISGRPPYTAPPLLRRNQVARDPGPHPRECRVPSRRLLDEYL